MLFTQTEAKQFFIDKVIAQAQAEGQPLSDAQQWMLSFSESDSGFTVDPSRLAEFREELDDAEYEARIAGLLKRSYERDREVDPDSQRLYRQAQAALAAGDHYLTIMIDGAIGAAGSRALAAERAVRPLRAVALFPLLVLPGALGVLLAAAAAWGVATNRPFDAEQATYMSVVALMLGLGGAYMIRLWVREWRK